MASEGETTPTGRFDVDVVALDREIVDLGDFVAAGGITGELSDDNAVTLCRGGEVAVYPVVGDGHVGPEGADRGVARLGVFERANIDAVATEVSDLEAIDSHIVGGDCDREGSCTVDHGLATDAGAACCCQAGLGAQKGDRLGDGQVFRVCARRD